MNTRGYLKLFIFTLILTVIFPIGGSTVFAAYDNGDVVQDSKYVDDQPSSHYNDGKYTGTLSEYLAGGVYKTKYVTTETSGAWSRADYVCKNGSWEETKNKHSDYTYRTPTYNSGGYSGILSYVTHWATSNTNTKYYPCEDGGTAYLSHTNDVRYGGTVTKDTRYYRFKGTVYAPVDPSKPGQPGYGGKEPGKGSGKSSGDFTWKLNKAGDTSKSNMILSNTAQITGNHYATRNKHYKITAPGVNKTGTSPLTDSVSNPNKLKGKSISYLFSYPLRKQ